MSRLKWIVLSLAQILLAAMFLIAGGGKFVGPMWARMFARWGYPEQFHLAIGAVEVVAGLGLLAPRVATPAALVLLVVMAGAAVTHVVHGELHRLTQIAIVSAMLVAVGLGYRRRILWRGQSRRRGEGVAVGVR